MNVTLNLLGRINGTIHVASWYTQKATYMLAPFPLAPQTSRWHGTASTLVFGDMLPCHYILLCSQKSANTCCYTLTRPGHSAILRKALQNKYRNLGDGLWVTVLSELPMLLPDLRPHTVTYGAKIF